jgi:hypothetical protein
MAEQLLYGEPRDDQSDDERPRGARASAVRLSAAPPGLLYYAATPNPVPYATDPEHPSVVTMMLVVANTSGADQTCTQLQFKLPVGGTGALIQKPGTIRPSASQGTNWSISSDQQGTLTATPRGVRPVFRKGDSIAFILENVEVAVGGAPATIQVMETIGTVRAQWISVAKAPPGLAITRLTATPIQIQAGEKTTLAWTTTGATECSLTGGEPNGQVDPSGELDLSPGQTTTYSLTVSGKGSSVVQQITVIVAKLEIRSFEGTDTELPVGGTTTLSWRVDNATFCTITPDIGKPVEAVGSASVALDETTTYTLRAQGTGGQTDQKQLTITVQRPPEVTLFTATPAGPVQAGTPVTLAWQTQHVTDVTIDQGVTQKARHGSAVVRPQNTTTYTLRCRNLNGSASKSVKVDVNSVEIVGFSVRYRGPGEEPGPWAVHWRVRNVTALTIEPGDPRGVSEPL